jgi:hypothetical protein
LEPYNRTQLLELLQNPDTSDQFALIEEQRVIDHVLGHASPQALVEMVPLLIAGAVAGGVAMAAMAAAAAVAMAVLTVASILAMGAFFGWYNSHKDRRRTMDQLSPCESTLPLDTNDPDCFNTRWKLIQDYYPWHHGLRRGDRVILSAEKEIETLENHLLATTDKNAETMFGHGGSLEHPARTAGLIRDMTQLLMPGSDHLRFAGERSMNALDSAVRRIEEDAIHDVSGLRTQISYGSDHLLDDSQVVLESQSASAATKTNLVTQSAYSVLSTLMQTMMEYQHDLAKKKVDLAKPASELVAKTAARIGYYNGKLESVEEQVHRIDDEIKQRESAALFIARQQISAMGNRLEEASNSDLNVSHTISDKIQSSLSDNVLRTSESFRSQLEPTISRSLDALERKVSARESSVRKDLLSNLTDMLESASGSVAEASEGLYGSIAGRRSQLFKIKSTISRALSKLSDLVNAQSNEVRDDVSELLDSIDLQNTFVSNRVVASLNAASGVSNGGLKSIVSALSEAIQLASQRRASSEVKQTQKGSHLVGQLGDVNIAASAASSDLSSVVAAAKRFASQAIGSKLSDISLNIGNMGSNLLDMLSETARGIKSADRADNAFAVSHGDLLSASISNGSGTILNSLKSLLVMSGLKLSDLAFDMTTNHSNSVQFVNEGSDSSALLLRLGSGANQYSQSMARALREIGNRDELNIASLALELALGDDSVSSNVNKTESDSTTVVQNFLDTMRASEATSRSAVVSKLVEQLQDRQRAGRQIVVNVNTTSENIESDLELMKQNEIRLETGLSEILTENQKEKTAKNFATRWLHNRVPDELADLNSSVHNLPLDMVAGGDHILERLNRAELETKSRISAMEIGIGNLHNEVGQRSWKNAQGLVQSATRTDVRDGIIQILLKAVLDPLRSSGDSFTNRVAQVGSLLHDIKRNVTNQMLELQRKVGHELLKLPQDIAINMTKTYWYESEIDTEIAKLNEELAVTSNAENQNRLMSDLVLLTQLRKVGATVSTTDLLEDVDRESSAGFKSIEMVRDSVENISSIIANYAINNDEIVLQEVAESVAILVNGLSELGPGVSRDVSDSVSRTLSDEAFDVKFSVNRNTLSDRIFGNRLNGTFGSIQSLVGGLLYDIETFENTLKSNNSILLARQAIGRKIQSVLKQVEIGSNFLISDPNSDILTRLGIVKYSTRLLTGLLFELGQSTSDSIDRLIATTRDTDLLSLNAVNEISGAVNSVLSAGGRIETVHNRTRSEWDRMDSFTTSLDEAMNGLVDRLHEINNFRYTKSESMSREIDETINKYATQSSETIQTIQNELDSFDDRVKH